MQYAYGYDTYIGRLHILENGHAITQIRWEGKSIPEDTVIQETPLLQKAGQELKEYFEGKRTFFDLPLEPKGTSYQKKVWEALRHIPYGETRSYKEIAHQVGNEKAARAVGLANHNNPIPILIPCHRVIGANGSLVGYAGGLHTKELLIQMEWKVSAQLK